MSLRNVRTDGDELLRKKSKPVKENTPKIQQLIDDMFETMYENAGVGLAAPQVGILKRLVVIDCGMEEPEPIVLINPVIKLTEGEQCGYEGCLSLPGKRAVVTRPDHVVCEALNRDFEPVTVEGTGLLARAICHECDHLDGIMYMDKAEGPIEDVPQDEEEAEEE